MTSNLKKRHDHRNRVLLAKEILTTVDVKKGLSKENQEKLITFLTLSENCGLSKEGRALNEISGVVAHVNDRRVAVTRKLILDLLKKAGD